MNVNQKGNIGQIKVIEDLYRKGYHCFLPFDDYCPVDLIALMPCGKPIRLQIKFRSKATLRGEKQDYYELSLRTVINGKNTPVNRELIDGWAVYLEEDDRVVYLHADELSGTGYKRIRSEMNFAWLK